MIPTMILFGFLLGRWWKQRLSPGQCCGRWAWSSPSPLARQACSVPLL
jgi:hypothetical protein